MNDAFIDPLFEVEWLDRGKKMIVDEMYSIVFCYVALLTPRTKDDK